MFAAVCTYSSLPSWVQGTVASVQQDMQQRLEEALAENKAQAESLREARERNMHFSARVVALNSRVAQLTKQVESSVWQPLRMAHLLLPFLHTLLHTHTSTHTHKYIHLCHPCFALKSTLVLVILAETIPCTMQIPSVVRHCFMLSTASAT